MTATTTRFPERRIPEGGRLRTCENCTQTNDNWLVERLADRPDSAKYYCPEPGCGSDFVGEIRVFAKPSDATDGSGFRQ